MKSSSDTKRDAIAGSKPQRHRPYEPNNLPPSLSMPDNNTKTTATGSGSGTTSSSVGAKSSTGTASSTAAASSSGAAGSATNTSTSSAGNNTASNTAALSEMITNRDPDLLLCLSRGELPRDRTRRAPRWYESILVELIPLNIG